MKHGSEKSSEARFESCIGCSRCLQLFHEFLLLPLGIHPCSIRVSSVAKRIFVSRLASFWAPSNGIEGFILLWLRGLRLITIGFDFRVFDCGLARGAPT